MNTRSTHLSSKSSWLPLALLTGAAAAWLIYRAQQPRFPRKTWQPILAQLYDTDQAQQLVARAEANYQQLLAEANLPRSRALRMHLSGNILPGLAMYRILLEVEAGDRQAALNRISSLFKAWTVQRYTPLMGLLKVFPAPALLFRLGAALQMTSFPKQGWEFAWLENSSQRIAFNAHSCYYLKTLTAYGAPELTPSFCQIDDWMGEMLPPPILFHRTQTLGRGDTCCDFEYTLR
jgi:hypothetical protein